MQGTGQLENSGPTQTSKPCIPAILSRIARNVRLPAGVVLASTIILGALPARAQELTSKVLSESGGRASSGSIELTLSQGQAAIGRALSGTTDLSIGFINALSIHTVEASSPTAVNPPFPLVGLSSLTVAWSANGNPVGTLYEARLSTAADFSAMLGSSQTYNLNAAFTGLSPNTLYHTQAAVYSTDVSSWSTYTSLGSTYTLAVSPGSPVGISTFTDWTGTGFTLNWSSGTGATGYNPAGTYFVAQISTSATFSVIRTSSHTTNLSATFTDLDQYVNYYARVQAMNGNEISTLFTVFGSTYCGLPFVYPGIVNTVAGNGIVDYEGDGSDGDGGLAVAAKLSPSGVTVDGAGNIYATDPAKHRIRKIDTNGHIMTLAGTGIGGFNGDGGQAASSSTKLNIPQGVATDNDGNIYFADAGNNRIRRIDSTSGIITTIAGSANSGYDPGDDGGLATNARLDYPVDVAVDTLGNIYIADYNNRRIRKVTNGTISTIAGIGSCVFSPSEDGGPATNACIEPEGVAVDASGNVYIAGSTRIRVVDQNGIISTVAPGLGAARLSVAPSGNLYVSGGLYIRRIDPNGAITVFAGYQSSNYNGDGIPATTAGFYNPLSVVAATDGDVYIADSFHARLREVSVATAAPTALSLSTAAIRTPTSVQWYWNKAPRTAAYKLLTSTGGIISGAISNRNTYFIETALSTNTLYSRELVALNSVGSTSSIVSAYTLAAVPSEVAFDGLSTSTVYLTWNGNTNPGTTSFEISYTTTANFAAGSTISTAPTTTSTFTTVASLAGQTTYYFRVRAYNGDSIATAFTSVAATATAVLQSSVTALSALTGTIGVAFTITGTAFGTPNGDATRVRFGAGGSTAAITSWSDTQISAIVPMLSSGAYALLIERQGSVFTTTDAGTFTVVTPFISTVTPVLNTVGFEVVGSGFGEFVDAATTKVLLDDTLTVGISTWTDTMIRCVISTDTPLGYHTARVVIAPSVGTVQSNAYQFDLSTGMRGQSLAGAVPWTAMPIWFYQGNLRLRAGGGKVMALSHASADVPPGALTDATSVSIERGSSSGVDSDARDKAQSISALIPMGAPIEFGPEGTRFAVPVTIELPYDLASVPLGREYALAIHYWDRTAGAWTALPTEVDTAQHLLRARTDHFSLYQPLLSGVSPAAVAPAEFRLVDVYAFPNPARRSQTVTIRSQVGLADDVAIRIYDISGRLVHSGTVNSAQIIDDGNGKGSQYTYDYVWDTGGAGSGVYLFAITAKKAGSSPIQKTGKVGVIK